MQFLFQSLRLGTFTCAGRAEQDDNRYIFHEIRFLASKGALAQGRSLQDGAEPLQQGWRPLRTV